MITKTNICLFNYFSESSNDTKQCFVLSTHQNKVLFLTNLYYSINLFGYCTVTPINALERFVSLYLSLTTRFYKSIFQLFLLIKWTEFIIFVWSASQLERWKNIIGFAFCYVLFPDNEGSKKNVLLFSFSGSWSALTPSNSSSFRLIITFVLFSSFF